MNLTCFLSLSVPLICSLTPKGNSPFLADIGPPPPGRIPGLTPTGKSRSDPEGPCAGRHVVVSFVYTTCNG